MLAVLVWTDYLCLSFTIGVIWAMPERKHSFFQEVFPYLINHFLYNSGLPKGRGFEHNVLSSTYVVEVGQILFFINQTLLMLLMVLLMVVDWCAHLFCVWDPFWGPCGALKGPWRLQKSPKTVYLAMITSNAPKWVEQGLNLVEHYRTHPGGYVKTI